MAYPHPPPFGRGRGSSHTYTYSPYGRGRGGAGRGGLSSPPPAKPVQANQPHPRFEVDGVTFELVKNGSKLQRITPLEGNSPTPLKHEIAGIKFFRTKGGNLLRHKEYLELEEKQLAKRTLCPKFTRTGQCTRDCRFNHDPNKLAACKSYMLKRFCPAGSSCALSHDLTPERTPLCHFFARGNCTNPNCQYTHTTPKEGAKVCEGFARLGYCGRGSECPDMHVFECPDYANKGKCDDEECHLPHIERAGHLRRLAGGSNDVSSNDNSDANDDTEPENAPAFIGAGPHEETVVSAFSQQDDFIRFGD